MAVTTRPFINGAIGTSTRAISWCPISPTKIALVYWAISGGVKRYFVQAVNFEGGEPIYSDPCQVAVQTITANSDAAMMRMAKIADDRLVLVVPEIAASSGLGLHSYHSAILIKVNSDNTFETLMKAPMWVTSGQSNSLQAQLPVLASVGNGTAYFGGQATTAQGSGYAYASLTLFKLSVANDVLTVTGGIGSPLLSTQDPSQYPYFVHARRDITGKPWIFQYGSTGVFWQLDLPGLVAPNGNCVTIGGQSDGKALLPIRGDLFLSLPSGTNMTVRKMTRTGNVPTGAVSGIAAVATLQTGFDVTNHGVEDAIWLNDSGMFMFLLSEGALAMAHNNLVTGAETLARMSTNIKLLIGQYNEATNTITMADKVPMPIGLSMSKVKYDSMLHKIDESTVACIGSFCAIGDITPAHGILMISSGSA